MYDNVEKISLAQMIFRSDEIIYLTDQYLLTAI